MVEHTKKQQKKGSFEGIAAKRRSSNNVNLKELIAREEQKERMKDGRDNKSEVQRKLDTNSECSEASLGNR